MVSFVPDPLGRVTVETTTEGDNKFTWDISPNGIGSIGQTTSQDGAVIDVSYHGSGEPGAGEVAGEHWAVDGLGFQVDHTYDSFGRPSVLQYPETSVTTHSRCATTSRCEGCSLRSPAPDRQAASSSNSVTTTIVGVSWIPAPIS